MFIGRIDAEPEAPIYTLLLESYVILRAYHSPWIFIGRTDAKAEAPILWSPDVKSPFIGKDSDAGKIEGVGDFFSGTWK